MTTFRGSFTFLTFKYGLRFENRWHQRVEFSWENLLTKAMNLSWNSEGRLNGCWFQACSQLSAADWESSLCLPTTWWVFLGHIRQQHRIPTTLSLMASTKMNRAVSRKCYYQGFFFFKCKNWTPINTHDWVPVYIYPKLLLNWGSDHPPCKGTPCHVNRQSKGSTLQCLQICPLKVGS